MASVDGQCRWVARGGRHDQPHRPEGPRIGYAENGEATRVPYEGQCPQVSAPGSPNRSRGEPSGSPHRGGARQRDAPRGTKGHPQGTPPKTPLKDAAKDASQGPLPGTASPQGTAQACPPEGARQGGSPGWFARVVRQGGSPGWFARVVHPCLFAGVAQQRRGVPAGSACAIASFAASPTRPSKLNASTKKLPAGRTGR